MTHPHTKALAELVQKLRENSLPAKEHSDNTSVVDLQEALALVAALALPQEQAPGAEPVAAPLGDCGNEDCGWRGPLYECSMLGNIGPCCPVCREIVEPDAPSSPGAAEAGEAVGKAGVSKAVHRSDWAQSAGWVAESICQAVAELTDRSSPEDWPEAMLVTHMELRAIVLDALFLHRVEEDAASDDPRVQTVHEILCRDCLVSEDGAEDWGMVAARHIVAALAAPETSESTPSKAEAEARPVGDVTVDWLKHDDDLRYVQRVLDSEATPEDRAAAKKIIYAIRSGVREAVAARQPLPAAPREVAGERLTRFGTYVDGKWVGTQWERDETKLIEQRDHAYEVIDAILDEVLSTDRPEWSSAYGTHDAVNDVKERMHRLVSSLEKWTRPAAPQEGTT